ncbi:hypothetical protein [Leptospira interrogans]|uniref:hypothetical protein n=1 Tax=Leptospira interrogans TaxID=173 RepID=UPI00188C9000|nr:hypothetical protein [Leptospira interrogans]MBF3368100.1 hypothetical protein [Leptospira interrogans serovar Pomona]
MLDVKDFYAVGEVKSVEKKKTTLFQNKKKKKKKKQKIPNFSPIFLIKKKIQKNFKKKIKFSGF